jgi:hypothetical protein
MSTRRISLRSEGAASNAQQRQASRQTSIGAPVVRATTVAFVGTDTITDTGNALASFPPGARIRVQGSARNDREFIVVTSAANALTVRPARVTADAAGPLVEIRRLG